MSKPSLTGREQQQSSPSGLGHKQAKKQKNTAQTRHICTIFFLRDERVLNMQEVKIVGRGVDTLVINVCYANEHFQPVKQELAKGVQHELEFYFAQRRMKYINRLASHVPLQYNCLNNTSIMLFTNQDREWFVTPPRSEGSRSMGTEMLRGVYPERSEWAQDDSTDFGRYTS